MEQQQNQEPNKTPNWIRATILAALLVLLVVIVLLPIKIVPSALSSLGSAISSLFIPREDVKLSLTRSTVDSGEPVTVSWTGKLKTNGSYTLSYSCATGVHLETSVSQPREIIPCNTQYYFTPTTNSITVNAYSDTGRYTDTKISLGFLENNATSVDTLNDITLTISNSRFADNVAQNTAGTEQTKSTSTKTVTSSNTTTTKKTTTVGTPTYYYPVSNNNTYGLADLEIRVVGTGRIVSGTFVPATTFYSNDEVAVRFQVVNVGNKYSGSWTFSADLPSLTDPRYVSPLQQTLAPGDRIEYNLSFRNLLSGTNAATINIDPSNVISEYSKANNVARVNFTNSNQGSYNPYNQYPYNQYPYGYGQADLVVRIISTGVVNRSNGQFTQTNGVYSGDRAGIRFEVQNIGTASTGSWRFRADLPSTDSSSSNYVSDVQPSLAPNEKAIFTVGFDNLRYQGTNTASITVDSSGDVSEYNENNNTTSVSIVRY